MIPTEMLQDRNHYGVVDYVNARIFVADLAPLGDIAAAFAQVVDSKSPDTSGHSERVTLFADMVAEQLGFSAAQRPKSAAARSGS